MVVDDTRANYTIFMTKGTHVVSNTEAARVLRAVRDDDDDVTVAVDAAGDGSRTIAMTLIVKHIVSLMRHNAELPADFDNVRFLKR